MFFWGQIVLFQWKKESTTQLNVYKNSPRQHKQQWGSPVAGATLQADAVEADAVVLAIKVEGLKTTAVQQTWGTTSAITCQVELLHLNVTMVLAAFVAAIAEAGATENAHFLFVALTGTKPSSAPKRVKHQCPSLRRFVVLKSHVNLMNGHHHMMFKC
jgi:hypothetical protein